MIVLVQASSIRSKGTAAMLLYVELNWCSGAAVVREKVYKLGVDVVVVEGEPEEAMDTS